FIFAALIEEKNPQLTFISELAVFGLIDHLTKDFKIENRSTLTTIDDDAAVLDINDKWAEITTDLLTEGVHFDLSYMPLKHLGYKAIIVNLSDVYAMNAKATQVTVSIAISNRFPLEAVEELYQGIKLACDAYQVDLIGGDTTSSNKGLMISVTAIGEINPEDVVYRNGAQSND